LRVHAIEFGESDVFVAGDGHIDGDGGEWDSARWSEDCDSGGDGGGSAFGQDADVHADGDGADSELCDCRDGDAERDGGESERDLERDADGVERIHRERDVDVYGGSAGNVVDHAGDADADGQWCFIHGDAGQRYDRGV
jgi:hypothetical protein